MESEAASQELRALEERFAMPAAQSAPVPIVQTASALSKLSHTFSLPWSASIRLLAAMRLTILNELTAGGVEDFRAAPVARDTVFSTYGSRSAAGPVWKPPALRSPLWILRDARWQVLFHQGTRLAPDSEA